MIHKKITLLLILLLFHISHLYAQFGLPGEICPANTINFTSPAPSAPIHQWDFCTGDLLETPSANTIQADIIGSQRPEGIEVVFDGNNWYGFITNKSNNTIIRVNFGNSLDNAPTYTNLGNPNNKLSNPVGISVMKDNSNWYAFVVNIANTPAGSITRINFGNNLNDINPIADNLSFPDMEYPEVVETAYDNGKFILVVGTWVTDIHILNFGNSFSNSFPTSINKNITGIDNTRIIRVIKEGNHWYGIGACAFGGASFDQNVIYLLDFGMDLFSLPLVTEFTGNVNINGAGFGNLYDVRLAKDGNQTYAFLTTSTKMIKLNFGTSINNLFPLTEDLGTLGGQIGQNFPQGATLCIDLEKEKSKWHIFAVNRNTSNSLPNELVKITFPERNCVAETVYSELINPTNQYLNSGNMIATLETFDNNFNPQNYYIDDFIIKDETIGNFIAYNQCLGESTLFQNTSVGSDTFVNTWEWDFGDGSPTSNEKEPQHTYINAGVYNAKLKVINNSGCENEIAKEIRIIAYPEAEFEVNTPRCRNQEVIFENTSIIDPITLANPNAFFTSYWDFGDIIPNSIAPNGLNDGKYTYANSGEYLVTLSVNDYYNVLPPLPCSGTVTKTLTIGEFPVANFTNTQACVDAPTQFTDLSTVAGLVGNQIIEWNWDFGGLGVSNLQNPSFTFESTGTYNITLTVKSICNCEHTYTQEVEVLPSIESLFTSSSVQGAAPLTVEFINQSIGADSYLWDFGDSNTSTEESPNYTFNTPGTYTVSFQAKNTLGCGTLVTETITVLDPGIDISLNSLVANENNGLVEISVEIKNENTSSISEVLLNLDVGNTENIEETWMGTLLAGERVTYTFQKTLTSTNLNDLKFICAEGFVQGNSEDINTFNNTVCYIISEDFDFINLSPNPARDKVILEYYIPEVDTEVQLEIIDELGKIVGSQKISAPRQGVNQQIYNINNLQNGVYHIRLSYGGSSKSKKLLIVK